MSNFKTLSITFVFGLIGLSIPTIALAESSVWKASKNGNHLFIGGTIHVLAADDYPLPCEFDVAYSVSDKLFFETDIESLKKPEVALQLIKQGTYPFGEELDKKLSAETTQALEEYLKSLGLPAAGFMKYKPGLLLSFITFAELNKLGITSEGVDMYFANLAARDNKPVAYLEEPEEQISFVSKLGEGEEEKFIQYIIDSVGNIETQFSEMRENWRQGELKALAKTIEFDKIRSEFPMIFEILLSKRNEKWLTTIDQLILSQEIEYVLVGAAHLIDKEGLLQRLESKDYQIDQLSCTYN